MIPNTITQIPNTLLEIISSRNEMIIPSSRNLILHVPDLPYITLGQNIEITSLETIKLSSNADDDIVSNTFDLKTYDDNGTMYYKARGTDVNNDGSIYYYKINGTKYTQPFKLCRADYSLRFSHTASLTFGYYSTFIYDEIAFFRSQVKDNPQSSSHQVIKASGVSFISESYLHEYVEIKAYLPYYAIRKLHQAQFMDKLYLVRGSGLSKVFTALEKMIVEIGDGDKVREVTISILPKTSIHHYQYVERNTAIPQPDQHFVNILNTNGLLSTNITGGSGNFNIVWLKDGLQVGTGTSYNSLNMPGNYDVIVLDTDSGLNAEDSHGIADLCENFSVSHEITDVADSTNKLITLSAFGTEPFTYSWEFSEDNILFNSLGITSNVCECEETGFYKYSVTDDNGCTKTLTIQVTIASHTVEITRNSNTLTATVSGCSEATLQWYINTGSGNVIIDGATAADLDVTENGLYTVIASCNGVAKEAIYLVLDIGSSAFMVVISKVWSDGGIQKAYAEVINAPEGVIGIEWYQRKSSGWVQVGAGDTITISEIGFLKVIATDENGNAVIDEMPQVADPTRLTLYNKFIISSGLENEFTITGFTIPNPTAQTVNDINAMWFATRGGIKLRFKDVAAGSLARDEFGIDYSNNKIYISSAIKIYQNEVIEFCNKYPYGT